MSNQSVLGGRTAEQVNARVAELAGKAYDAADPGEDPPVFALSALATAFVTYCKAHRLTWDQSVLAMQTAWAHSGEPLRVGQAKDPKKENGAE